MSADVAVAAIVTEEKSIHQWTLAETTAGVAR